MSEFADVLRSWRDRVSPADVGLPAGVGRRTTGLRREELAALAGVSVDYVVRLEQGRATNPSPQMLRALAVALRLSDDERDHLYRSAGAAPPSAEVVPRHVGPGVQRIVDRLGDVPLAVFSATHDILL
ncbi:helix-turn-helix transcriptional regulator [Frigoribacterium sp. MEB024]|nr:helix-turn-helix transcriptional regulator [Frigoribacterium sp. MEB024]